MKFNFNEREKIYNIVQDGCVDGLSINKAIWSASIYYTQIAPIEKDKIFLAIVDFMNKNYSNFMYYSYTDIINRDINRASKYRIKDVNSICITKNEMNKILSLGDIKKEKIAFVILALAKYQNAESKRESDTFYAKTSEIFKLARVTIPSKERDIYFRFAYQDGLLKQNFSIGYNALTADFVEHAESDVVLMLDEYDYLELAYAFLNYKNGGYKRCRKCGRWFRAKHNASQYCSEHKPNYDAVVTKEIECVDCGNKFVIQSSNTRSCRCQECQRLHVLKYDRERKKNSVDHIE